MLDNSEIAKSFLSHNSRDKPAVEVIRGLLERGDRPIPCWFDKDDLRSKGTWMSQLEDAVAACGAAVVFYGPDGRGPVHKYEIDLLLKRAMYEQGRDALRLVLVLLPGAQENAIQGFISLHMWADFRKGLDDSAALQRLRAFILGEAPKSGPGDDPRVPKPEVEPYRGLEPFEGQHAIYFFGRDKEIKKLCGRLNEWPFTAVIGGSGSGKSSIVRAGLQTELATQQRPALAHTTTITVRPGSNPIRSLADQVVASLPDLSVSERLKLIEVLDQQFRTGSDKLFNVLRSLYPKDDHQILLVVDQFEELFTHSTDTRTTEPPGSASNDNQQTQFVELLAGVARSQLDRLRVVITLRADFFDRCLSVPTLKSMIENRTLLLGNLSDEALRTVVEAPAFKVGAYFEKGLVARILKDVANQNGSLPLLQHALKELWEQRRFGFLTDDGYDETGGVEGALKKRANAALENLKPDQREIAKNVFLRLTTLGEGVSDTRRRVRKNELYPAKADPRVIDDVLKDLSSQANRLIVTNDDGTVEVTHEALIQRWDTLRRWLADNRDDKRLHDRLRDAANEWADPQHGRDPSYLWEGGRLDLAEKFDQTRPHALTSLEREFLAASIAKAEHAKRQIAQRTRQRRVVLGIAAVPIVILAIVGPYMAIRETRLRTEVQHQLARVHLGNGIQLFENGDFLGALIWFVEAARVSQAVSPVDDIHRLRIAATLAHCPQMVRLVPHDRPLALAACNQDGSTVFMAANDGSVTLCDLTKDQAPLKQWRILDGVTFASFSTDGRRLVTISGTGAAQAWDSFTGELLGPSARTTSAYQPPAAASPDGSLIAYAEGTEFRVVDVIRGIDITPKIAHAQIVRRLSFSPTGDRVLVVTNTEARVWDAKTGEPQVPPFKHEGQINAALFSPDGKFIVTAGDDLTARVWDAATGEPIAPPLKHEAPVRIAAFSPNHERLVTATNAGAVQVWNIAKNPTTSPQSYTASTTVVGVVTQIRFSADSRDFLTITDAAYYDDPSLPPVLTDVEVFKKKQHQTIHICDATSGERVRPPLRFSELVRHASFSPDGQRIIAATGERELRLWDTPVRGSLVPSRPAIDIVESSNAGPIMYSAHPEYDGSPWSGRRTAAIFSPDRRRVVSVRIGEQAHLWDVASRDQIAELGVASDAWFSANGQRIVTVGEDDCVRTWDAITAAAAGQPIIHRDLIGAARSHNGKRLATHSKDHTVRIWNAATGEPVTPWLKHGARVRSMVFNFSDDAVMTVCDDGTARVWNSESGQAMTPPLKHDAFIFHAAFSPLGHLAVTASGDGTARVWDTKSGAAVTRPLSHSTAVKYASISPKEDLVITACFDGTARIWDANSGDPITPPLMLRPEVYEVSFSPDGQCAVLGPDSTWRLPRETRSISDLLALARVVTGREVDDTGAAVPIATNRIVQDLNHLRRKYPANFQVLGSAE